MNYLTAGIAGLAIGIIDLLLLILVQKKGNIFIFDYKKFYKQKTFWLVLLGMTGIGIYFMWLIEAWDYIFGVELLICGYLLPVSIVDRKYKMIPDTFHVVYGAAFVIYKAICATRYDMVNGGIATLCVLVLLGAVHLVKKEQFGLGDLKLLCVCAFLTGIPSIAYLFVRGLVVAAVYSVVQMLRHKADLKTEFPLAPFLLIGVLI